MDIRVGDHPPLVEFDERGIPAELKLCQGKLLAQWVVTRLRWIPDTKKGGEKLNKPPLMVNGRNASTTDPATWCTYGTALAAVRSGHFDAPGFVFTPDDHYVGVDLDGCRDPVTGEIDRRAQSIVTMLASWTEVSVSGTGLHILVRATLPPGRRSQDDPGKKHSGVALYQEGRYFVLSGVRLEGTPAKIFERQKQIDALHAQLFPPPKKKKSSRSATCANSNGVLQDDDELLDAARKAPRIGGRFRRLFDAGDISGYPSQSEADLALCNDLSFWANGDAGRVDELFRCSALMRDKWDEPRGDGTYGSRTIEQALDQANGYTGQSSIGETSAGADDDGNDDAAADSESANGETGDEHADASDNAWDGADIDEGGSRASAPEADENESGDADTTAARKQTAAGPLPQFSEEILALRFTAQHRHELRFIGDLKRWILWDEVRWEEDRKRMVFDYARAICRNDSRKCKDKKLARQVASSKTRAAVISLASDDQRITIVSDSLDANPWLLGTPGGTVDMRTGHIRPARREDYITRLASVAPAPPGRPCPTWDKFLETTFVRPVVDDEDNPLKDDEGNELVEIDRETIRFVERWLGYCLSGDVREHKFVFGYGGGRNGKTTLFEDVMLELMADYAQPISSEVLMERPYEPHKTEIASLAGARLVVGSEIPKSAKWNEARLTQLTGGSRFRANFMRQDEFSFKPTLKLTIIGNRKPRFSTINTAIRERLLLLLFRVEFVGDKRDPDLLDNLRKEYPAILRRCIEGGLEWQRDGLKPPQSVLDDSERYLQEEDTLQEWLDDCLVAEPAPVEDGPLVTEALVSFNFWCQSRSEKPTTRGEFGRLLDSKNIRRKRKGAGVRLLDYQFTPEQAALVRNMVAKQKEHATGQKGMF